MNYRKLLQIKCSLGTDYRRFSLATDQAYFPAFEEKIRFLFGLGSQGLELLCHNPIKNAWRVVHNNNEFISMVKSCVSTGIVKVEIVIKLVGYVNKGFDDSDIQ